jgi:hypothetical protein
MRRAAERLVAALGLGALLAAAAGCGRAPVDVTGGVTYQGRAVEVGSVTLVGDDGRPVTVALEGGRFAATVPAGPVRVGVSSYDPGVQLAALRRDGPVPPEVEAEYAARRAKWFPVPPQYGDPRRSGLEFVAGSPGQAVELDLK